MVVVIRNFITLVVTLLVTMVAAVAIEITLDMYGVRGHRLLTGVTGTLLIVLSIAYSARKKKLFTGGSVKHWLQFHEWAAIVGTVILLIHTGTHFEALIPVVTLVLMLTTFVSGLFGRYLYQSAKDEMKRKKDRLKRKGMSETEIEEEMAALTTTSEALAKWRVIHMPIVAMLSLMTVYHAISALYYGGF
ncbi:MAG: hypothetical protein OEV28_03120 [Nitrospirota bacterium]|nr:hypothetical protein [Nitrospirota bacterium]